MRVGGGTCGLKQLPHSPGRSHPPLIHPPPPPPPPPSGSPSPLALGCGDTVGRRHQLHAPGRPHRLTVTTATVDKPFSTRNVHHLCAARNPVRYLVRLGNAEQLFVFERRIVGVSTGLDRSRRPECVPALLHAFEQAHDRLLRGIRTPTSRTVARSPVIGPFSRKG